MVHGCARRLAFLVFGCLTLVMVGAGTANCTITQGDFSIFGNFRTQWGGRWGETSDRDGHSPNVNPPPMGVTAPASHTGGSFDFNHWDLVEAKMVADLRPDYHVVKNFSFLGRLDTIFIKDADLFAIYRGWYDAFGDFKDKGIGQPFNDFEKLTAADKNRWFKRDDLREYYAQINVTDNLSFRVGKQEIIWSEADALSGTEVLNPADLRFHWTHFETPEDQRRNIRMVKMNYVLGDFYKTSNNEYELFWIPGDFQGYGPLANVVDKRMPYFAQAATAPFNSFAAAGFGNQEGQYTRQGSLIDGSFTPTAIVNLGAAAGLNFPTAIFDFATPTRINKPKNKLENSEFGMRYSSLLPVGNGLQVSLIWEYLFRAEKTGVDPSGPPPPCVAALTCMVLVGPNMVVPQLNNGPGIWVTFNTDPTALAGQGPAYYKTHPGGLPMAAVCIPGVTTTRCGQFALNLFDEIVRANFWGLTGTYYDKDLTDIVFRYDFAYLPKYGYFPNGKVVATPVGPAKTLTTAAGMDAGGWTDKFTSIIAFDRPTYIPWLSKQHTFLVAQQTYNWYPGTHRHPLFSIASTGGKLRKMENFTLLAAINWLMDGRLVSTNAFLWDDDNFTGFVSSNNAFRYSRNILFDFNFQWYLGKSGRFTDPLLLSRDQRINEAEFRFVYEI